ncbi:MAG: thiamine pyrophosphate-binding protein [Cyanophyceae cyanobacterium]
MSGKTGRFAILEQLVADGFQYIFGNPGTVEQGFLDALQDYPDLNYILTLQETVAVMAADGYARATKKPAIVQIHSTPGLGNSIGALYQAKRGHSPLVVLGGDAGVKYVAMDAQMAGDLVAMAEPVTKWAAIVVDASSLLRMLRRAIKIAATPPMGPVYLCLPQDILDQPVQEQVIPTSIPSTRSAPPPEQLQQVAEWLAHAQKPMIFIGDGIAYSQAQPELAQVAELVGAEVWEADNGELNMSHTHPLYQGTTGHMFGSQSLPILGKGDVNLVCGTYIVPEVFPELSSVFATGSKVVHIDLNAYEIAKNHPVDLGMVTDPKTTLSQLAQSLEMVLSPKQKAAAEQRTEQISQAKFSRLQAERHADQERRDDVPLQMSRFAEELAAQLPDDAIIFDEALTNSPALVRYYPVTKPEHYFVTRGGSLGVGIPGAIGAKLAHPDKTVIALTGDGGAMYTIQSLWTAARHHVAAKFVICNNRSYRILQYNIRQYWSELGLPERDLPLSFDLSYPAIRFDELARGMGVEAVRVEKPDQITSAIQSALAHAGPFLIDLVLEGTIQSHKIGVKSG